MKEVVVVYLGSAGGGVHDTFEIVESLSRSGSNGYSVLISENNPLREKYGSLPLTNVSVIKTHKPQILDFVRCTLFSSRLSRAVAQLYETRPSGILITMWHPWIVPIVWAVKKGLKETEIIYIRHNQKGFEGGNSRLSSWLLYKIDKFVIPKSAYVITLSEHVRASTIEEFDLNPENVVSIGFGAHTSVCKNWKHSGFLRNGTLRVLLFGRITMYKGVDVLLSAIRTLKAQGIPINVTIAGKGEIPSHLTELARELEVNIVNHWLSDDELCRLLSETDVVVMPYTRASQSGPASVATALGIPAIATDVGGLSEQVIDGVNGMIIKHGSYQELANALKTLAENPELLHKHSEGAMKVAHTKFSWLDKAKKIDELFSALFTEEC